MNTINNSDIGESIPKKAVPAEDHHFRTKSLFENSEQQPNKSNILERENLDKSHRNQNFERISRGKNKRDLDE